MFNHEKLSKIDLRRNKQFTKSQRIGFAVKIHFVYPPFRYNNTVIGNGILGSRLESNRNIYQFAN